MAERRYPSLADQHESKCRHFTGLSRGPCKAGIAYDAVRVEHAPLPVVSVFGTAGVRAVSWPCLRDGNPGRATCPHLSFPTRKEAEAYERESHEHFARHMQAIADDVCPDHRITIRKRQVGRCVYAEPCGCRLYQGTLPKGYAPKHETVGQRLPAAPARATEGERDA